MPTEAASATAEILLLEQTPDYAEIIREAAESTRLSVVRGCPDVLEFLHRRGLYPEAPRPDLILLDLDLSRTEDCEVLTEIKKSADFRRIPVIVLASSKSATDIFQAYDLHANAYIYKPDDRGEFLKILRETLHFWLALVRLPKD